MIKQMVQMKNRVSGLLMETMPVIATTSSGCTKVGYFGELMTTNKEVQQSIRPLLKLSRDMISRSQKLEYALVSSLERDPLLQERLRRLRTVPGVSPITALTWRLWRLAITRGSHRSNKPSATAACAVRRRAQPTR